MKIAMACDHGALGLKNEIKAWLTEQGHEVTDFGTNTLDSCDYADFVEPACRAVAEELPPFAASAEPTLEDAYLYLLSREAVQ